MNSFSIIRQETTLVTLFHTGGGGEGRGADSTRLQTVFLATSVRGCSRTTKFGDFSKHLMDNKILNRKMKNF